MHLSKTSRRARNEQVNTQLKYVACVAPGETKKFHVGDKKYKLRRHFYLHLDHCFLTGRLRSCFDLGICSAGQFNFQFVEQDVNLGWKGWQFKSRLQLVTFSSVLGHDTDLLIEVMGSTLNGRSHPLANGWTRGHCKEL